MSTFVPLTSQDVEPLLPVIEKIAKAIFDNSNSARKRKVNITGPLASLGEQKESLLLSSGARHIYVNDSNKNSFICNGLVKTNLEIKGKINHLLIRGCQDSTITVHEGVISGISILGGNNVTIDVPRQNTTSLEQTSQVNVKGLVTDETIVLVSSCMEISINGQHLPVNVFDKGILTQGRFCPIRFLPPDLQALLV